MEEIECLVCVTKLVKFGGQLADNILGFVIGEIEGCKKECSEVLVDKFKLGSETACPYQQLLVLFLHRKENENVNSRPITQGL